MPFLQLLSPKCFTIQRFLVNHNLCTLFTKFHKVGGIHTFSMCIWGLLLLGTFRRWSCAKSTVEMHKKSKCHNISSSWAASPFLTATFSLKFNPPASIWWICWNGRVRIWILAPNLTARFGCDFQWEETQLHHLHHSLNLRHLLSPVQPVLYHNEILSFQLSWLASILCRDKCIIIQIANPMESCRIMARIRILMQQKQLMYFKSTLYACKHSDSCTQVYHIPTRFLFEAFDDSNLYATMHFV